MSDAVGAISKMRIFLFGGGNPPFPFDALPFASLLPGAPLAPLPLRGVPRGVPFPLMSPFRGVVSGASGPLQRAVVRMDSSSDW